MVKCDFCGDELMPGTGKLYVKKDGKKLYFCSNKCEKNMFKLGRKPLKTGWTEEYRKAKSVEK